MAVARWAAAAGVVGVVVGGLGVGVAVGTPEEDCQAVRDRDHQIWLQIVASLPPGAPIPPEPVNPCIAEDPSRAPGAEGGGITDVPGTDLGAGEGRGPQVGTNAPGRIGDGAGGVIVDVPGAGGGGGADAGAGEHGPGRGEQVPTGPGGQVESAVPGAEDTGDRAPVVAEDGGEDGRGDAVPGRIDRTPAPAVVDSDGAGDGAEDPGGKLWLLLTGLAGAGVGAARLGRGRAPWAGKTGYVTIPKLSGEQTLFVMADEDSDRTHRFDQPVPDGGRMEVLDDGSAVILDADGAVVATVAPPWAFDAQGRRVPTWYTVSEDGQALIQHVEPDGDAIFPIIADPEYTPEQRVEDMKIAQINPSVVMPPDANAEYQEALTLQHDAQQRLAEHPETPERTNPAGGSPEPKRIATVDVTGREDGDTWTERDPDTRNISVHTIVPGSGGRAVDTTEFSESNDDATKFRSVQGEGKDHVWRTNPEGEVQSYEIEHGTTLLSDAPFSEFEKSTTQDRELTVAENGFVYETGTYVPERGGGRVKYRKFRTDLTVSRTESIPDAAGNTITTTEFLDGSAIVKRRGSGTPAGAEEAPGYDHFEEIEIYDERGKLTDYVFRRMSNDSSVDDVWHIHGVYDLDKEGLTEGELVDWVKSSSAGGGQSYVALPRTGDDGGIVEGRVNMADALNSPAMDDPVYREMLSGIMTDSLIDRDGPSDNGALPEGLVRDDSSVSGGSLVDELSQEFAIGAAGNLVTEPAKRGELWALKVGDHQAVKALKGLRRGVPFIGHLPDVVTDVRDGRHPADIAARVAATSAAAAGAGALAAGGVAVALPTAPVWVPPVVVVGVAGLAGWGAKKLYDGVAR